MIQSEYGTVDLKGMKELDYALKQLPIRAQKKVLKQSVSAGAAVIRKEARKNARKFKRTGNLAKKIKTAYNKAKSRPWFPIYEVGCGEAFYGKFIERGFIAVGPKGEKGGTWKAWRAARKVSKGSRHVAAKPWLRPALSSKEREAIEKMRIKVGIGIEREAAKLAK